MRYAYMGDGTLNVGRNTEKRKARNHAKGARSAQLLEWSSLGIRTAPPKRNCPSVTNMLADRRLRQNGLAPFSRP